MKRYAFILLAVLSLSACRKNVEPEPVPSMISIEPFITKATEVNFETGDKIGLTVVADGAAENYATNE